MNSFHLTIELGNDNMCIPADVADALRRTADVVATMDISDDGQPIRDLNGNTVGRWEVRDDA